MTQANRNSEGKWDPILGFIYEGEISRIHESDEESSSSLASVIAEEIASSCEKKQRRDQQGHDQAEVA